MKDHIAIGSRRPACRLGWGGLVTAALMLTAVPVWGRSGELPPSARKATAPLAEVARLVMPPIDAEALRAEDRVNDEALTPGPIRFAASIEVELDLLTAGTWEILADGARLGRLRVASPGALSLNFAFRHLELPAGGGLWLYDSSMRRIEGPYRHRDGALWTPVILGEEVVVELYLPADGEARVTLQAVHHGYRLFGEPPAKQGACNIDVVCPQANPYRDQVRAAAGYTHTGIFFCSGALLNNTAENFRPFFITADHCGLTPGNANSVVVFWNFESPTCGQLGGGSLDDNQEGATFRATYQPADTTLIELDEEPAAVSDVFYAGWDARGNVPQSVVGIHHPSTDEKAISFEGDPLVSVHVNGYGGATDQNHWMVTAWDVGTTEPGSSGSCIFDQGSKKCVGVLTGGFASCSQPNEFDVYGKLSVAWNGGGTNNSRLRNWLDPVGGGNTMMLDGTDPGGAPPPPPPPPGDCVNDGDTLCLNGGRFKVEVEWSAPGFPEGPAFVSPLRTDDSGLFYFVDPNNLEFLIKALDGCGITNHFWVFFAATTTVEFTVTVTDTDSGMIERYTNPLGQPANAVTDTMAFATCP